MAAVKVGQKSIASSLRRIETGQKTGHFMAFRSPQACIQAHDSLEVAPGRQLLSVASQSSRTEALRRALVLLFVAPGAEIEVAGAATVRHVVRTLAVSMCSPIRSKLLYILQDIHVRCSKEKTIDCYIWTNAI